MLNYKTIGKNIRECRRAKGLKQEALAEMVDLSVSYMSALERGVKLPRLETFVRIANTLEVSSDTLLCGVLSVQNKIIVSDLSQSLAGLPPAEQTRILHVIKTMISDIKSE